MKVAVVGLGIAGLIISARLALAGHDVSGFEQFGAMHEEGSSHGDTRITRLTPGEGEIYVALARRAALANLGGLGRAAAGRMDHRVDGRAAWLAFRRSMPAHEQDTRFAAAG